MFKNDVEDVKEWLLEQHNVSLSTNTLFSYYGKAYKNLNLMEAKIKTLEEDLKTEMEVANFWQDRYEHLYSLVQSSECSEILDEDHQW